MGVVQNKVKNRTEIPTYKQDTGSFFD